MTTELNTTALAVFVFFFVLVTVMGFVATHWRRPKTLAHIDEWGLGGRSFGIWITWFLVGGDFYTAYTVIAVPALVYTVGAYGFFALPYTIIVYPFVFMVMPLLWQRTKDFGYVTAGDVVHGQFGSRGLELAVAVTGVIATMPYIALQLVGMTAALKALGLHGEVPLAIAFIVLALYTYSAGLRAPALIAFVKDIMIYIVVIAAVALIPSKLGGYANVFAAADAAFQAKGSGSLLLQPNQYVAYATLALGSALAAFMYPHTLTGIFASNSGNTIRKNAALLPAYTLLLGLLALLGYMGHAAGLKLDNANDVVPALFQTLFPSWFAGFAFAAIAIGALLVILFLPTQFALDLQLLDGVWILQTFPALVFGLYTNWFRAPGLIAGWFVGFFGGTLFVWINGLKPLQPVTIGETSFTVYIGVLALVANIFVAAVVNSFMTKRNQPRAH